jgi:hypothetical protein
MIKMAYSQKQAKQKAKIIYAEIEERKDDEPQLAVEIMMNRRRWGGYIPRIKRAG